jgi:hypothetical protein
MYPSLVLIMLGLLAAGWLTVAYRRAAGTTLRAPIAWQAIALVAVIATEIFVRFGAMGPATATAWRYLAAVGTFCPAMALLGAKRPQDGGWQFIVASLWLILSLPALQTMVFAPASRLDLHPAWRAFLMLLVTVTLANYLPTRFGLSAVLFAAAQLLLLHAHTPIPWPGRDSTAVLIAVGLAVLAATLAGIVPPRRRGTITPSDRAWLDFRNAFGAVWALRVMERINQAARSSGGPDVLQWDGFADGCDPLDEKSGVGESLSTTIRMLLRRFVSADWIERRRPPETDE